MAETQGKSIADLLYGFRRRWWIVALCFAVFAPLAAGVALILPPVYSASARIIVESQQIPDELARATVTASANERVELIRQLLTTRQNLVTVIEKNNLYGDRPGLTLSDKVDLLRESTTVSVFEAGTAARRGPAPVVGFIISARAPQAVMAATIANEFVTLALDLNLRQRTERATETVAFFAGEVDRLTREIDAAETALVGFKQENAGALPEMVSFRQQEILALERAEVELETQRGELANQRSEIAFLLTQQRVLPATTALSPVEEQLRALKTALGQQLATLAPNHPQIRAIEGRIAALEKELASSRPDGAPADAEAFERERMERQIARLDEQIARIDERLDRTREQIALYRAAIARAAEVEFELRRLEQRFAGLQEARAEAQAKRADAETGEKLEVNRQAERFVVLEQAQVPQAPEPPGRLVIAGAGVGASLALGIGLVLLLELMSRAIMTPTDLERRVGLKAVVVIPYISTRREIRNGRIRLALILLVVGFGAPTALWLVDQQVMPLSVIAEKLMDRTGLRALMQLIEARI